MASLTRTARGHLTDASKAHTDLNTFGSIITILEGGHLYSGTSHTAADKIIKLCKREMQRLLIEFDEAEDRLAEMFKA